MSGIRFTRKLAITSLMSLLLSACNHPPYNGFHPYNPYNHTLKDMAIGAGVGTTIGFMAGNTLAGTGIGAAAFAIHGLYKENRAHIFEQLKAANIQYERYGDTMTLIVPTDRYFLFNSARLNEVCYPGLVLIARLLRLYPHSVFYVAGFTDNIGSRHHKRMLSQAQAETMLTFLWANGIQAKYLNAEGYADKHAIADNKIIHGSAQNRRVEIQWIDSPKKQKQAQSMPYLGPTK